MTPKAAASARNVPECPERRSVATTVIAVSTADIEWLNTNETAKRLGITPRTLYRFIDDGKIPAYRFGRVIRLKESEVAEFIEPSRIVPGTLDAAAVEDEAADRPDATGRRRVAAALAADADHVIQVTSDRSPVRMLLAQPAAQRRPSARCRATVVPPRSQHRHRPVARRPGR